MSDRFTILAVVAAAHGVGFEYLYQATRYPTAPPVLSNDIPFDSKQEVLPTGVHDGIPPVNPDERYIWKHRRQTSEVPGWGLLLADWRPPILFAVHGTQGPAGRDGEDCDPTLAERVAALEAEVKNLRDGLDFTASCIPTTEAAA